MKPMSQLTQPIGWRCFAGVWVALFGVASAQGARPFPVPAGRDGVYRPSPVEDFVVYGGTWTAKDGELEVGAAPGPKPVYQGPLFADTKDPDYLAMLRGIEQGRRKKLAHPRADMSGFAHRRKEP